MYIYVLILILPYLLLLSEIFRNLLKVKRTEAPGDPGIFISVIIACRNEEISIPGLVQALEQQDYPSNLFEVLIVDDNSYDNTVKIAASSHSINNLRILSNHGSGKKAAIKTGINVAAGKYILTTDADCLPPKTWIRTIADYFEKNNPDLIIGPVMLADTKGFFGKFQELEFLSLQAVTAGTAAGNKATMCNGANLAFKKDLYLKCLKYLRFDLPTGDDIFLLHAAKYHGKRILWIESHDSLIQTRSSGTFRSFILQRGRWASKALSYRDLYTTFLGIVTFVTISIQTVLLIASFIDLNYFGCFLFFLAIKSIPDFLLLYNTTERYGKLNLLKWFLPTQIVYPIYVLVVTLAGNMLPRAVERDINSPFQKGT
jgi:cellulose synthase/poly-beta-1,6-N-acetylglucosamine synthase-like glycosyltransferase